MRKIKLMVFTLFFTVSVLFGCSTKEKAVQNEEVSTGIEEEQFKGIMASGIVKSKDYESFFSGDNGVVGSVAVSEGQIIKKDDVLLTLDNNIVMKNNYNKAMVYRVSVVNKQNVSKGQELIVLGNMDSYIVEGYILEEVIKDVKVGEAVTIVPKADILKKYFGKVSEIYGKAERKENGEAMIKVIISIDNSDDFLKDGFNVDLEIDK